jgi:hypothetical protein
MELGDRNALLSNSLFDSNFTFLHRLPRIAKLTMATNLEETGFELGLKTHKDHGEVHGYPVYICRYPILGNAWDKIAFIQSIILDELLKTPERRLEWVMYGPSL